MRTDRRSFLKTAGAAPAIAAGQTAAPPPQAASEAAPAPPRQPAVSWPRKFSAAQLQQIAFPLGGIAAGSISLGGRGQLRDWEIYNRPDKGNAPAYSICSIWAQVPGRKPVARVAEARYLPPYEGQNGLGSNNAPGLPRLDSAVFTGAFPIAQIDFRDRRLPVKLSLEAFTPFFPLDADSSGLPVAVLRYRVTNPNPAPAQVAICYSIDNPVNVFRSEGAARPPADKRAAERRDSGALHGLLMTNAGLPADHAVQGDFTLAALDSGDVTIWRGWPQGRWWNSPMLFWDEFSAHGRLGAEPDPRGPVGAVCIRKEIPAGGQAEFTFVLAWRFANRTPARCGWSPQPGAENAPIGNHYCTRFPTSWAAAETLARDLAPLEQKTRAFVRAMRESSLPGAVKDGAMSNLSTLVTQVCFRTADGEFHGFEGANDRSGCCYGNCTHVWNYETSTAFLFPSLAVSLRNASFTNMLDERGAIHFRERLPKGHSRSGIAATDGQMGQIMKAYLDWKLSGDNDWLKRIWPGVKRAMEFSWIPGGWDADRDGVPEGAQHNTYDVEFYGPNPMCGVYYLGALRACEEMAKAQADGAFATECRRIFERGSKWIDSNLFNGEFYIQKVRGLKKDQIAKNLTSDMGSDNTENPEYQVGDGCLVDQLIGQYQAEVCGLGPLLDPAKMKKTLESIYRYNYKRSLMEHESVQRIFALNDEAALLVCDYGKGARPRIPFPYYAELFTGLEWSVASHMLYAGMIAQGLECIESVRRRYDGQRRNPWNEAECGHHYARAMAAWSPVLALSGFDYHAPSRRLAVKPRRRVSPFRCFWSTATGWGSFELGEKLTLTVEAGWLEVREVALPSRTVKLTSLARATPEHPLVVG
ncbi:MAG: hypothetical protein HY858_05585 [Candidatus Solibacter usitatus]|nr:hypothetical protein [Candidatus Solibacter usitatus]